MKAILELEIKDKCKDCEMATPHFRAHTSEILRWTCGKNGFDITKDYEMGDKSSQCPLQPTKLSSEVEELFEEILTYNIYPHKHITADIIQRNITKLKTKFQQMQQEIEELKSEHKLNDEAWKDDYDKMFKVKEHYMGLYNQYKQLLDKIELSEDTLGWYLKVGKEREYTPFEIYNIIKQIKEE